MYNGNDIDLIIQQFVSLISTEFPVKYLYLFGSYAKGEQNADSDIDIAVISDNFVGSRFLDREKLAKYIIKASHDLEIHPFRTEDFTSENPFVEEIMKTGRKII
ncbi:MAG: nucleotidyltransferase domain-containing protein [Bacteroidota bacterium]|nr:nucleotidyltransferase domain-containing protein [Bacteroidota bacterium]